MAGISQLLETARRALQAQQIGMGVTGHNIANVNTPGYTRQKAELQSTPLVARANVLVGTGVYVESIQRLRSQFLDQQIRGTNEEIGLATTEHDILSQVEAVFNEPSASGLNSALTQFFQAWQELSVHPEDAVTRTAVEQAGQRVTSVFRRLSSDLTDMRLNLRDDLSIKVDTINQYASEIAEMNVEIVAGSTAGRNMSDVRDMRDQKLEALSTLANIAVVEDARGSVTVTLGGTVITSASNAYRLQLASAPNAMVSGTSFDQVRVITEWSGTTVDLAGGEAGGALKAYNATLPDYLGSLDQLAVGLVTEVNRSHASGYGAQVPPQTGINFFVGTDAASIGIDLTDTSGGSLPGSAPSIENIAASSVAGENGNNDIALLIANAFEHRPVTDTGGAVLLGGASIAQFYQNLITELGSDVESAEMVIEVQDQIMSQLTQQREAISGVSLDEEMTNMIKFQRAFEASARVVNVANEMFETILQMV